MGNACSEEEEPSRFNQNPNRRRKPRPKKEGEQEVVDEGVDPTVIEINDLFARADRLQFLHRRTEEAITVARSATEHFPKLETNVAEQYAIVLFKKIGDYLAESGRLAEATTEYQKAISISEAQIAAGSRGIYLALARFVDAAVEQANCFIAMRRAYAAEEQRRDAAATARRNERLAASCSQKASSSHQQRPPLQRKSSRRRSSISPVSRPSSASVAPPPLAMGPPAAHATVSPPLTSRPSSASNAKSAQSPPASTSSEPQASKRNSDHPTAPTTPRRAHHTLGLQDEPNIPVIDPEDEDYDLFQRALAQHKQKPPLVFNDPDISEIDYLDVKQRCKDFTRGAEGLLLRVMEAVETGHTRQSDLLLAPLEVLANLYDEIELFVECQQSVRKLLGILLVRYGHDHPAYQIAHEWLGELNTARERQIERNAATMIVKSWRMRKEMLVFAQRLGRKHGGQPRRHTAIESGTALSSRGLDEQPFAKSGGMSSSLTGGFDQPPTATRLLSSAKPAPKPQHRVMNPDHFLEVLTAALKAENEICEEEEALVEAKVGHKQLQSSPIKSQNDDDDDEFATASIYDTHQPMSAEDKTDSSGESLTPALKSMTPGKKSSIFAGSGIVTQPVAGCSRASDDPLTAASASSAAGHRRSASLPAVVGSSGKGPNRATSAKSTRTNAAAPGPLIWGVVASEQEEAELNDWK